MAKQGFVYFLTNSKNTVIYTGVTSKLKERIFQHKNKLIDGFSKKYNLTKLVYYEVYEEMINAIEREKQIKAGSRARKISLIQSFNPKWKDLYDDI